MNGNALMIAECDGHSNPFMDRAGVRGERRTCSNQQQFDSSPGPHPRLRLRSSEAPGSPTATARSTSSPTHRTTSLSLGPRVRVATRWRGPSGPPAGTPWRRRGPRSLAGRGLPGSFLGLDGAGGGGVCRFFMVPVLRSFVVVSGVSPTTGGSALLAQRNPRIPHGGADTSARPNASHLV